MSASALKCPPELLFIRPFVVCCLKCRQKGLFATVEGAVAATWIVNTLILSEKGGTKTLEGECAECITREMRELAASGGLKW